MEHTNNNSTLSNEELTFELKKKKSSYTIFITLFFLTVLLAIYISYKDGFSISTVIPVFLLPALMNRYNSYCELKEEAEKRTK